MVYWVEDNIKSTLKEGFKEEIEILNKDIEKNFNDIFFKIRKIYDFQKYKK